MVARKDRPPGQDEARMKDWQEMFTEENYICPGFPL
jgi:hypothetical protein